MSQHVFDDSNITWRTIGDLEHLHYHILAIKPDQHIANVLFKFGAGKKIVLHRHMASNDTFVVQGEHRLYRPDGSLKEVRQVGSMTCSGPDNEPHSEGGGPDQDVIIAFSIHGDGLLYQLLDEQYNEIGTLTFQDLKDLHEAALAEAA